ELLERAATRVHARIGQRSQGAAGLGSTLLSLTLDPLQRQGPGDSGRLLRRFPHVQRRVREPGCGPGRVVRDLEGPVYRQPVVEVETALSLGALRTGLRGSVTFASEWHPGAARACVGGYRQLRWHTRCSAAAHGGEAPAPEVTHEVDGHHGGNHDRGGAGALTLRPR